LVNQSHVFHFDDTLQKREFVNQVFDNNLYYENGIYRTPTMLNIFSHNHLKMKEKGYLIYKKIGGFREEIPLSEPTGSSIEHLDRILAFFEGLKRNAVM
jgi:site-specific DNA recombinase